MRYLLYILALIPVLSFADGSKVKPAVNKQISSENGRFAFGQISDYRRDQFMLDTQTGRLWKIVVRPLPKNPDGTQSDGDGLEFLSPVPYSDGNGSLISKDNNWNYTAPSN